MAGIQLDEYSQDLNRAKSFLQTSRKYSTLLKQVAERKESVIRISLDDIIYNNSNDSDENNENFAHRIETNTVRYLQIFYEAIDSIIEHIQKEDSSIAASLELLDDPYEILTLSRKRALETYKQNSMNNLAENRIAEENIVPPALLRNYEVYFDLRSDTKPKVIREVRSKYIGNLVKVRGIVTRVSDVRPLVTICTYICDICGNELYQVINDMTYMPLFECKSEQCKAKKTSGKIFPEIRGCKFVKFQELRMQELPEDVPVGHVPRMMTVHLTGVNCRAATAGDHITVTGVHLPVRYKGFAAARAGLLADTFLECMDIINTKKTYTALELTPELESEIMQHSKDPEIFEKLSKSIAPEIFGHNDIKKALLCLMVGGSTREKTDVKIRGNINMLLVGDPGVAKSQFLKYIGRIAPRAVYTTGKGSSGVGLTAAVLKDPVTKEYVLEGGALVLADIGICCIDEFDKMEDSDRTAIHEVMEQQTVSISKAGINTVLNARTSILAAANPIGSRYNPQLSVQQNVDLPVALTSRFDLLFILVDKIDWDHDSLLARHVCLVHQLSEAPSSVDTFTPFSSDFIHGYISIAKKYSPYIPVNLTSMIVNEYITLRQQYAGADNRQQFCTARVLLSILRLSQALAKIRFRNEVTEEDVQEGIRLLLSAQNSAVEIARSRERKDPESSIYAIIRNYANNTKKNTIKISEVEPSILMSGFTLPQIQQTLEKYSSLKVWQLNEAKTSVTFVSSRHVPPKKDIFDFDDNEIED